MCKNSSPNAISRAARTIARGSFPRKIRIASASGHRAASMITFRTPPTDVTPKYFCMKGFGLSLRANSSAGATSGPVACCEASRTKALAFSNASARALRFATATSFRGSKATTSSRSCKDASNSTTFSFGSMARFSATFCFFFFHDCFQVATLTTVKAPAPTGFVTREIRAESTRGASLVTSSNSGGST